MEIEYKTWTKIEWDGNPALNLKCWRKSFGKGHVSVGVGHFLQVVFSYGANSGDSMSSTRWKCDGSQIPEQVMMDWIDKCDGRYKEHPAHKIEK